MKQFEVGKKYLVYPKSLNSDYELCNIPTTMVVVKRTESTIWCEIDKNAMGIKKETHRILKVSKERGIESIDCGYKDRGDALHVWATDEIKEEESKEERRARIEKELMEGIPQDCVKWIEQTSRMIQNFKANGQTEGLTQQRWALRGFIRCLGVQKIISDAKGRRIFEHYFNKTWEGA